nr:immunoglobulin heavy chain junction region [Macaca mulatta]
CARDLDGGVFYLFDYW